MLRRLARAAIAHGARRTGADRSIGWLSGAWEEPLILGYHRVLPDSAPAAPRGVPSLGVRLKTLERHLEFVGRRFRFVSLDELGSRIEEGTASGRAAVTFDDGYVDFHEIAFPMLQRKGIPAAVFVVTGLLENAGGFLHDRLYAALENAFDRWSAARVGAFLAEKGIAVTPLPDRAFPATRMLLGSLGQEALAKICATLELSPSSDSSKTTSCPTSAGRISRGSGSSISAAAPARRPWCWPACSPGPRSWGSSSSRSTCGLPARGSASTTTRT